MEANERESLNSGSFHNLYGRRIEFRFPYF